MFFYSNGDVTHNYIHTPSLFVTGIIDFLHQVKTIIQST